MRHTFVVPALAVIAVTGCSSADDVSAESSPEGPVATDPTSALTNPSSTIAEAPDPTAAPSTSSTSTTSTTTTSTTTTSTTSTTTTTTTTTTTVPDVPGVAEQTLEIGVSVEGRPIVAERFGTEGGRRVLVIGVIHGNEDDGVAIIDELRLRSTSADTAAEIWLVESMNPDGQAAQDRHNANQVDLNRNFPDKWGPIGAPGDGQYAGPAAASEPETRAMVDFISALRPDIVIWYHQDLFVINPGTGRAGRIRARYAELTGLPMGEITGGTYTGIAATWAANELDPDDGVAFIVELGSTLSATEAATHADAVLTIAAEG